jgi:hypothetical protein
LGPLWNAEDYKPKEVVEADFTYTHYYIDGNVGTAGLEKISAELFAREQEKAKSVWVEANNVIRRFLRGNTAELVNHMVERLQPTSDGKKKVFRKESVENIQKFIGTFYERNLTDDKQLEELVTKLKGLTEGLDPETVRSDDGLRTQVTQSFSEIKEALDKLVVAPSRFIELE